jgi:hypothetical protein
MTMNLAPTRTVSLFAVAFTLGAVAGLAVERAAAATKPEYRVIATNSISIGPRGADQYLSLLQRLGDEGWRYDHSLDGFVVFRR